MSNDYTRLPLPGRPVTIVTFSAEATDGISDMLGAEVSPPEIDDTAGILGRGRRECRELTLIGPAFRM